jgi:hypothetical protein
MEVTQADIADIEVVARSSFSVRFAAPFRCCACGQVTYIYFERRLRGRLTLDRDGTRRSHEWGMWQLRAGSDRQLLPHEIHIRGRLMTMGEPSPDRYVTRTCECGAVFVEDWWNLERSKAIEHSRKRGTASSA